MKSAQLLRRLQAAPSLNAFIRMQLGQVPWIFGGDAETFAAWRRTVVSDAELDGALIYIVGSAATGYSLSPLKPGRPFRPVGSVLRPSDIDIAIVDEDFFIEAWEMIVKHDRARTLRNAIEPAGQQDPVARARLNVYWGTVSNAGTPSGTTPARRFTSVFSATTRAAPFLGYSPKARVYRRIEDLVSYHEQSLQQLVRTLRQGAT